MRNVIVLFVTVGMVGSVTMALVLAAVQTGPGCPGMDPSWIGWCR